jgi:hypothetical protein
VPRIAHEKNRGLHETWGADHKTRGYFSLHATANLSHARVWPEPLGKRVAEHPHVAEKALNTAERTTHRLRKAMDGIEAQSVAAESGIV